MRKKILGTDLKVSAIGLGCMGMNHAYGASVDKTEMINLIAQAVDIVCPVTAIQNRYSMMARWHEKLFPVLEELNIGFVAFSPLANGFLSGKYNAQSVFEKNTDYRSIMPQFPKDSYEKNQEFLAWIQAFAEEKQIPIVGEIPRSDEIIRWEDQGKTVIEGDADSEISKRFFELAEKLLEDETERVR